MLFQHQQAFLDRGMKKGLLVWSCGSGKTLASLIWGKHVDNLLVICPKTLVTNWVRSIEKLNGSCTITTNKQRTYAIVSSYNVSSYNRTTHVMSKEFFKAKGHNISGIQAVIADEVHYFSGIKSKLHKTLKTFLKVNNIEMFLGLTGTPYLSTPFNVFAYGQLLGLREYAWSYIYFQQQYFFQKFFGRQRVNIIKAGIEDEMAERIKEIADVVHMENCMDVPESNFETEYFALTVSQQKEWEKIFDPNGIVMWTKRHQLCGGTVKGDGYTDNIVVSSDKFDRVIELCQQHQKIILVCRYNLEIDRISEELTRLEIPNAVINGDVKDKQAVIDEAESTDRCILIVNAACSEGWEAKSFDTMVFFSYDFSLKNYIQMMGRIQRAGALQKCNYISLIVEKTIDEDVYKNVVEDKQDFHLAVYKI